MPSQGVNTVNVIKITSGTTAGADGSASNRVTTTEIVSGQIVGVYISYAASTPSSTTLAIGDTTGTDSQSILTLTNASDSGWFYPGIRLHSTTGTALGTNIVVYPFVNAPLTMTVTGVNSAKTYTARVLYA